MNRLGRAVLLSAGALLIMLSVGSAWASEFSDKVERIFPPAVFKSAHESDSTGTVDFKVPDRHPEYFENGDKANKVFAIDSVRIFRDLPKLDRLIFTIPREGMVQTMEVTRSQIEQYYKISLSDLAVHTSKWREDFIQRYDNQQSRAEFVEGFVTEK